MGAPFDLRIYVAVTSPYPWNRGVTVNMEEVRDFHQIKEMTMGKVAKVIEKLSLSNAVTPRSHGYGNVTATYIRRSEIPSRIYAKH